MIRVLESEGSRNSISWKSVVPATVYFICEVEKWKETPELTSKVKREVLESAVERTESDSFLYAEHDLDNHGTVEFDVKSMSPVTFEDNDKFAYKEVVMDIIYEGQIEYDFDASLYPDKLKGMLDREMEDVGRGIWIWFHDQYGFRPEDDYPEYYAPYIEDSYCTVTNGTDYAPSGWGEWFKYPPNMGEITINGKPEEKFFRDLEDSAYA